MLKSATVLQILTFALLFVNTLQHGCGHDDMEHDIKISDPAYKIYSTPHGRLLKSYNNISLFIDNSTLTGVSTDFSDYVVGLLMPAVTKIIGATLQVPSRTSNLTAGGYSTLCGGDVTVPSYYNTLGVDADLVLFVRAVDDSSATYVASASAIIDTRISQFTLALLEGTGWYQVNYAMAEPMTWGKNKGCSFISGACVNNVTAKTNFNEFCPALLQVSCSWTLRAGSSCGAFSMQTSSALPSAINWWNNDTISQDTFSDNCPTLLPYTNLDCEDSSLQSSAMISSEYFGYGSKCFMATLYPKGKLASAYPYCFKPTCKLNSQGAYYIQVSIGSQTATCTASGSISVSGYNGVFNCPDPAAFCQQIMTEGFCRRGCTARGSCVNQTCVCNDGWTGFDCSKPTFLVGCVGCSSNSDYQNTCYGDVCTCDPSNSTCDTSTEIKSITALTQQVTSTGAFTTTSSNPTLITQSNKITRILIPVLASLFGLLAIVGITFVIWYVRKIRLAKKLSNITPQAAPIMLKPLSETFNSSLNSPERLRRPSSGYSSHNDSPIITRPSPVKDKIYAPSVFSNFAIKPSNIESKELDFPLSPPNLELKDVEAEDIEATVPMPMENRESCLVIHQPSSQQSIKHRSNDEYN